ncbi:MAG: DnaJ domain-containing protein [Pseudomonadota bacterium]
MPKPDDLGQEIQAEVHLAISRLSEALEEGAKTEDGSEDKLDFFSSLEAEMYAHRRQIKDLLEVIRDDPTDSQKQEVVQWAKDLEHVSSPDDKPSKPIPKRDSDAPPFDPYRVLGVSKSETAEGIKAAYRQMALKFHPERTSGGEQSLQRFKEISRAYEILRNPETRTKFDSGEIDAVDFDERDLMSGGAGDAPEFRTPEFQCLSDYQRCVDHFGDDSYKCSVLFAICVARQLIPFTK